MKRQDTVGCFPSLEAISIGAQGTTIREETESHENRSGRPVLASSHDKRPPHGIRPVPTQNMCGRRGR